MSRTASVVVTAQRLVIPTVIAALLAVPVLAGPPDHPTPRPLPVHTTANTVLDTVRANAERQHSTLVDEDIRLLTLVRNVRPGSGPYVQTRDGVETLVLTARGLAYELADLRKSGAVATLPTGDLLLTRSVFVAPGARLVIDAPGRTLRLRSEASGFVSLVAWKSDLVLRGAEGRRLRVSSWDHHHERPDTDVVDGRAYIREVSGDMRIAYVNASHLGFWAGRTSGVAWTGSARAAATGSIVGSTFRSSHYGVFVSSGDRLSITDTAFASNAVDGLSLHRNTTRSTIRASTATGNRRHGFSADRGTESVTFTQVTAAHNGAHGIFFSGTPLSVAQSAGGASLRTFGGVHIVGGLLRGNGRAGLRVVEGHEVDVRGTRVADNRDGIVLVDTAPPTTIEDTLVTGEQRVGISVTGGSADVRGNRVTGALTGIRIRDAAAPGRCRGGDRQRHLPGDRSRGLGRRDGDGGGGGQRHRRPRSERAGHLPPRS
jgi:hypothetical protein